MNLLLLIFLVALLLIGIFFLWKIFQAKGTSRLKISEWDEKLMAYHEAGHAVVFSELFGKNLLGTVTIDSNKNEFGSTKANFNKNLNETYNDLILKISVALSGRLSEQILLNEFTTSAIHDLSQSTFLATNMVIRLGMGKNIKFLQISEENLKSCSNELKCAVEKDICSILDEASKIAEKTIIENTATIEKIARILLSKKTIYADELQKILD